MRLKAIAAERAPTIATVIQSACQRVGSPVAVNPRAASSAPRKAKGSAKSVCSILIISSVVRMLLAAVAISVQLKSKSQASQDAHEIKRRARGNSHGLGASLAKCQTARRAWRCAKKHRRRIGTDGKALSTKPHAGGTKQAGNLSREFVCSGSCRFV